MLFDHDGSPESVVVSDLVAEISRDRLTVTLEENDWLGESERVVVVDMLTDALAVGVLDSLNVVVRVMFNELLFDLDSACDSDNVCEFVGLPDRDADCC